MPTDGNLSDFIENHCNESHLRVQEDLGDGFVRLRSEEAERRQAAHDIRSSEDIVIEMLRNARDAGARNIFLATGKEGSVRTFVMIDDGSGIPAHLHQLIFEPRVTSKLDTVHMDKWGVHGRGMALFSIDQNARLAKVLISQPGLGSSIKVQTDTNELAERADQSTFPVLVQNESGKVSMRGPKNILRTACEFALEHRHSINVYVGSMAEICATLYMYGVTTIPAQIRAFGGDQYGVPYVKRLAYSADPEEMVECASELGLEMSQRSAYRILEGKIPSLSSMLERMSMSGLFEAPSSTKRKAKGKGAKQQSDLKIPKSQLEEFSHLIKQAYEEMAHSLYLSSNVSPKIQVTKGEIKVSIPLVKDEDL